ncbi:P-loop containing nucleoside triphosphate hydrolase protein [Phlegmacium glaucopus]|nr:P-loop containing nucleoside triphosphate hydrolase protein [Phlegmacium glaucopus]
MGPSGSGKSTFINTIANSNVAVGHKLESCTSEISTIRISSPDLVDSDIVFVDTPGFDHTNKTDIEILKMVADWLKSTYQKDILLSGLLYCHRISNTQMAATSVKHLRIFEELCGKNALQNVILVTTMWDEVDEDSGKLAEEMMKTKYWNKMLERNSTTGRFLGTRESALHLLLPFIDAANKRTSLLLQQEMVDMKKKLTETSAGRQLFARAERMVRKRQEVIQRIRTEMKRPISDRSLQPLQDEHQQLSQLWDSTTEEMRAFNPPVGRRFLEMSEKFGQKLLTLKSMLKKWVKVQGEGVDRTEGEASLANDSKESFNEVPGETGAEVGPRETVIISREGSRGQSSTSQSRISEDQTEAKILVEAGAIV